MKKVTSEPAGAGLRDLFSGLAKIFGATTTAAVDPDLTDHQVEIEFEIAKLDEDERLVFGWANVSMRADGELIVDRQGDIIEPAELEKAAYDFVLDFRESGVNHKGETKGRLVESLVVTPEKLAAMGLAKDALPTGWWIGVKIDDPEVFKRVKKGELAMFSIQGSAQREAA